MKIQTVVATLLAVLIGTAASHAQGHAVRVFISNGFKAVFDELVPACERSIGHSVTAQSGTSTSLIEKVNAGEPFDVAIMTTEAMESLAKAGKVCDAHAARPIRHWHRQPRRCQEAGHRKCRGAEERRSSPRSRSPMPAMARAGRTSIA